MKNAERPQDDYKKALDALMERTARNWWKTVRWNCAYKPDKDPVDAQEQIFEVEGTKGNKYAVKHAKNGSWSCECVGYGFRRKCKHIEKVKEKIS